MRLSGTQARSISSSRGLGNTLWDLAGNRPSLDLRFAESKSLVDATTGTNLVTFTRASSGTYVGSDGLIKTATTNEPRFTHDPVTGESLGLLVEEQRVNLLQRTEEFDNAVWITGGSGTVQANTEIAPDGSLSGDLLTTEGNIGSRYQNVAVQALTQYTFSVYVKLGTMTAANYKVAFYDNTANAFISQDVVPAQLPSSSRWTRVAFTVTAPAGCTSMRVYPFRNGSVIPSSTVFLWGAQLEAGAFPTSYIKNIDNPLGATRAADVVSISGSNFSSWYRQDEGTVYWEGNSFASTETGHFGVQNASSTSFVRLSRAFNQARSIVAVSSVNQADIYSGNTMTLGANNKIATAIKANDFALSLAGGTVATDTSGTMPTVDRATIGTGAFLSQLNGTIRRLTYFPTRLPNSTLQTITQ